MKFRRNAKDEKIFKIAAIFCLVLFICLICDILLLLIDSKIVFHIVDKSVCRFLTRVHHKADGLYGEPCESISAEINNAFDFHPPKHISCFVKFSWWKNGLIQNKCCAISNTQTFFQKHFRKIFRLVILV